MRRSLSLTVKHRDKCRERERERERESAKGQAIPNKSSKGPRMIKTAHYHQLSSFPSSSSSSSSEKALSLSLSLSLSSVNSVSLSSYLILWNTSFPSILSLSLSETMGEYNNMKRVQIPAFGNWEHCDEMPITQYFESAMQAGLIRGHFAEDADLFKIPVAPLKPATNSHYSHPHHHSSHNHRKGKKSVGEQQQQQQQQVKKQGRVYDLTPQSHSPKKPSSKVPKAVDEDLYKIPPELLYQKPKRKRLLKNLWSGCLGLNSCVA